MYVCYGTYVHTFFAALLTCAYIHTYVCSCIVSLLFIVEINHNVVMYLLLHDCDIIIIHVYLCTYHDVYCIMYIPINYFKNCETFSNFSPVLCT